MLRLLSPARAQPLQRGPGRASRISSACRRPRPPWTTCPAWLAEITLDPPLSTGDRAGPPHLDEDYVVISTVHSAKGLEWSSVHLPHLVDGAFPSDMALGSAEGLAEERRLFYVATTRARDRLTLYTPLRMPYHRRAHNDRHGLAQASRFLDSEALSALEVQEQAPLAPARAGRGRRSRSDLGRPRSPVALRRNRGREPRGSSPSRGHDGWTLTGPGPPTRATVGIGGRIGP